ncbi:hypothetical protein ACFDAU_12970 [Sulfuriferula sp. GW1]|uniref:hypothetical protein n=1 Tax=Sulfuriferula sp. GW1 TaxID=3345111 RepID=UPI0039AF00BA
MNTKLVTTLVAIPLLAMSSMVFAAEPMQLSDAQMDSVTAGGLADAFATAIAIGKSTAATETYTLTTLTATAPVTGELSRLVRINSYSQAGSASIAF